MAFSACAIAITFSVSTAPASALLGLTFLLWSDHPLFQVLAPQHNGKQWTIMFVALEMAGTSWAATDNLGKESEAHIAATARGWIIKASGT